jgi:hypothetical protein
VLGQAARVHTVAVTERCPDPYDPVPGTCTSGTPAEGGGRWPERGALGNCINPIRISGTKLSPLSCSPASPSHYSEIAADQLVAEWMAKLTGNTSMRVTVGSREA